MASRLNLLNHRFESAGPSRAARSSVLNVAPAGRHAPPQVEPRIASGGRGDPNLIQLDIQIV